MSSLSLNPLFPFLLHVTCLLTSVSLFYFSTAAQKYHPPPENITPKVKSFETKTLIYFHPNLQFLGSQIGSETWVCPFSMHGSWLVGSYFSNQEQIGDKTLVFCWRRWSVGCDHWSLSQTQATIPLSLECTLCLLLPQWELSQGKHLEEVRCCWDHLNSVPDNPVKAFL